MNHHVIQTFAPDRAHKPSTGSVSASADFARRLLEPTPARRVGTVNC
jgi:hypothetical protein